jgi:hypothetical protein
MLILGPPLQFGWFVMTRYECSKQLNVDLRPLYATTDYRPGPASLTDEERIKRAVEQHASDVCKCGCKAVACWYVPAYERHWIEVSDPQEQARLTATTQQEISRCVELTLQCLRNNNVDEPETYISPILKEQAF